MSTPSPSRRPLLSMVALATSLVLGFGCTGTIDGSSSEPNTTRVDPRTGTGGGSPRGTGGAGGTMITPPGTGGAGGTSPSAGAGASPLRRLTRREYNNTVRDLLGDTTRPADQFPSDRDGNFLFRSAGVVAQRDATLI